MNSLPVGKVVFSRETTEIFGQMGGSAGQSRSGEQGQGGITQQFAAPHQ